MATALRQVSNPTLPLGYRGVRASVLVELKTAQPLTTRELASRLDVSVNAVRHHLKGLEEQGLVEYQRERRGVGAPRFAYRLSAAGEALFPRRYEALLLGLLNDVATVQGRARAVAVLESQFAALTDRVQAQLAGASPEQRLTAVAQLLSEEGYMAKASSETLTEHNCAVQAIAQQFPEICAAEAKFLSTVLDADISRERHILNGCTACEYRVRFDRHSAPVEENA
jgi:DeoR family transcriptional regulator, suf operon transcriptional repressor